MDELRFAYRAFGLSILADRPLVGIPPAGAVECSESVEVRFGSGGPSTGVVRLSYGRSDWALTFAVELSGRRVWATWSGQRQEPRTEAVSWLLLGPVITHVLQLRGQVCLHASAVEIDGRAALITGEKGAGKSTLAAAMAQAGYGVLADDLAALVRDPDGGWHVHPGCPRLHLRRDAVEALAPPRINQPSEGVEPGVRTKHGIALSEDDDSPAWRFQANPLPVATVVELAPAAAGRRPAITAIRGADRVGTLVRHRRRVPAATASAGAGQSLTSMVALAETVPFFRLTVPRTLSELPAVCRLVEGAAGDR